MRQPSQNDNDRVLWWLMVVMTMTMTLTITYWILNIRYWVWCNMFRSSFEHTIMTMKSWITSIVWMNLYHIIVSYRYQCRPLFCSIHLFVCSHLYHIFLFTAETNLDKHANLNWMNVNINVNVNKTNVWMNARLYDLYFNLMIIIHYHYLYSFHLSLFLFLPSFIHYHPYNTILYYNIQHIIRRSRPQS